MNLKSIYKMQGLGHLLRIESTVEFWFMFMGLANKSSGAVHAATLYGVYVKINTIEVPRWAGFYF